MTQRLAIVDSSETKLTAISIKQNNLCALWFGLLRKKKTHINETTLTKILRKDIWLAMPINLTPNRGEGEENSRVL